MSENPQDPFDRLFTAYHSATGDSILRKARANIKLVQELRERTDIPKDSEDMAYLESIQKRSMELLDMESRPLDKLRNSETLIVTQDIRDKYERMCIDVGNLVIKLRPYMAGRLGAVV